MEHPLYEIIEQYGIYAVFALCTVEGDITLLISGVLAHSGFFGKYSFAKVLFFGTLGGIVGDSFGYMVGRLFQNAVKNYRFYKIAQPRIERLIDKFGGFAIIISKYIYGIRGAMCLFYGIGKMPYWRFLLLDFISCFTWVVILSGTGYFFSGAITSVLGDFQQIGIALFFIILVGVVVFYLVEHYWLSPRVEEASPETLHRIEETIYGFEEAAQGKLHDLGERLHFTSSPNKEQEEMLESTNGDHPEKASKKTGKKKIKKSAKAARPKT
ncbi:MAG: DedA family protein [Pyrinomonadaceae bacterium]